MASTSGEINARTVAEAFAEAGRENYERDGHVIPCLHILDPRMRGVMLVHDPDSLGESPRDAHAFLASVVGTAMPTRYLASVTEAWCKAYETESAPDLVRGELQQLSATDPEIRTAVLVVAIDVDHPERSYSVNSILMGDQADPQWDSFGTDNPGGGLVEDLLHGFRRGRSSPLDLGRVGAVLPEGAPLQLVIEAIGAMGLIQLALLSKEADDE